MNLKEYESEYEKHELKDLEFAWRTDEWFRNKFVKRGLFFMFRTTGEYAGTGFKLERRVVEGATRLIAHYVKEGKVYKEPLDYFPDKTVPEPADVRPIVFSGGLILTSRVAPSWDDSDESFRWMVLGYRAESYVNLKDTVLKMQNELDDLGRQLDTARRVIKRQEREIDVLSEKVRVLEQDVEALSREKMMLEETISKVKVLLKKYMAYAEISTEALNEILRVADSAGLELVIGGRARIWDIIEDYKRISEEILSAFASMSNGNLSPKLIEDFRVQLDRMSREINELRNEIKAKVKEKGVEVEAVAQG